MTHLRRPQHQRRTQALTLGFVAGLGLLTAAGCETPRATTPFEQARDAFAAGQWAESIMFSTEAISQHPDDLRAYVLRGRAFRRIGQLEPAITDYTIAIQLKPDDPEFYYLRADAYKDRGDIDLSDADNKTGQKLDPTYQRAYLYAPRNSGDELPSVAEELSRSLRDSDRESPDEPSKLVKRPGKHSRTSGEASSDIAIDLSPDELFESADASAELTVREPEIKDIYGLPVEADLNRPSSELLPPTTTGAGPTVAENSGSREILTRRHTVRRKPISADLDLPALEEDEQYPRTAENRRGQRDPGRYGPENYPPQRSLHPFGTAAMRSTGVPSETFDEEPTGELNADDGGRGARGPRGGGQFPAGDFGPADPNAIGGRGNFAPLDPYGGYTPSAKPIGPLTVNPYGGAAPYGRSVAPSAARRRNAPPRDPNGTGRDANRKDSGGRDPNRRESSSGAVNPFGPLPSAPVPLVNPPGFRYD